MLLKIQAFFLAVISVLSCISTKRVDSSKMKLSNPNADTSAVKLYEYICSINGKAVLSGQQEGFGSADRNDEFDYIHEKTGKLPTIRGFDFINNDFDGVVTRAEKWWNDGGIVTICWHCGKNMDKGYTECCNDVVEDWNALLTPGTPENIEFTANLDKAGNALKKLQNKGIPVLWRPFHEFNGMWFWWGKDAEQFKRLWIYVYNHFTDDLELNNLIWVLGYSEREVRLSDYIRWYPGDGYCDIIGADSYHVDERGADRKQYGRCVRVSRGTKPVFFHECGLIPSPEEFEDVPWIGFVTWHTEMVTEVNSPEHLRNVYNSEIVLTRDELPSFR